MAEPTFSFFANTKPDSPMSYQSLLMRRKIAEQLMGKRAPYPQNIGQGIASLGESIGDKMALDRLDKANEVQSDAEAERRRLADGGGGSSYIPTGAPPPAPAAPPQRMSELPPAAAVPPSSAADASPAGPPSTNIDDYASNPMRDAIAAAMYQTPATTPFEGDPTVAPKKYPDFPPPPSFTTASGEPGPTPGQQPAPSSERVPLPPPRPAIDRTAANAEIQANPELAQRIATIARGEVGNDPRAQQVIAETIADRAKARNQSLDRVTQMYTGRPNDPGYYPASTFGRGQASPDVVNAMLRGSDVGRQLLGFSPTGNASSGVASRGGASGLYNEAGRIPGSAETFVQQASNVERPERLDTARQVAALGGELVPTAAAARNNPPSVRDDIRVAENVPPDKLPIPGLRQPVPEAVRQPSLGMSDRQKRWFYQAFNPENSDETRAFAKQQYEMEEMYRKEQEKQNEADFVFQRQQRSEDVRGMTKQQIDLLEMQKRIAEMPTVGPQAQANLAKAQAEYAKMLQELQRGQAPEIRKVYGADMVWDPSANGGKGQLVSPNVGPVRPETIDMTEKQANTVKFLRRAQFANAHLGQSDAKLTSFWENAAGNVPMFGTLVGNYLKSPEYRMVKAEQMAWGHAVLRDESGALIGDSELAKKLDNYFPVPGDDPHTIAYKAQARQNEEASLADSLGNAKPVYDRILKERAARKVEEPGKFKQGQKYTNPKTGETRIFLNGYMEDLP